MVRPFLLKVDTLPKNILIKLKVLFMKIVFYKSINRLKHNGTFCACVNSLWILFSEVFSRMNKWDLDFEVG